MALAITGTTQAYANHGRWIADCPREYCGNAIQLQPRQQFFECAGDSGCGMTAVVEWPDNVQELTEVLMQRPVPSTRNWFPHGHPLAVRARCEMGQTPAELLEEQRMFETRNQS